MQRSIQDGHTALTRQFSTAIAFEQLDETLRTADNSKRTELLRQITDLFFHNSDRLSDEQTDVFDRTLLLLVAHVEKRALIELSRRLAAVENAPTNVIRTLARDPEISVAEPILANSLRLTSDDLAEIAGTSTQAHLLVISRRRDLTEKVSDVLIAKGNGEVLRQVAANPDCRISHGGFERLVHAAKADDALAEMTGARNDLPKMLWQQLITHASDTVRRKLLARLGTDFQGDVTNALTDISAAIGREVTQPLNFEAALQFVTLLQRNGELNEAALAEFARTGRYEETICALALLSSSSIEVIRPLMHRHGRQGLLVPCRAAQFSWDTVSLLLRGGLSLTAANAADLKKAEKDFLKLSVNGARRLLRFWQARNAALTPQSALPTVKQSPGNLAIRKFRPTLPPRAPVPEQDRIVSVVRGREPQVTGKDRIVVEAFELARELVPDGVNTDGLLSAIEEAAQQGERDSIKLCDIAVRAVKSQQYL